MARVQFEFQVSNKLFKKAEKAFLKEGLDIQLAIFEFFKETAKQGKIPFELPYATNISDKDIKRINRILKEEGFNLPK